MATLAFTETDRTIVGVDETGRGSLIGPVITCAVAFPAGGIADTLAAQLGDSKALSARRRVIAAAALHDAVFYAFGAASSAEVVRLNPLRATMLAMSRAVARLPLDGMPSPYVLVDGNVFPAVPHPGEAIIKGDAKIPQIMAASILAKVFRDRLVGRLAIRYPGYGLDRNPGYGSPAHFDAIMRLGPCRHHRSTVIRRTLSASRVEPLLL
jgi:ribonuclease HII